MPKSSLSTFTRTQNAAEELQGKVDQLKLSRKSKPRKYFLLENLKNWLIFSSFQPFASSPFVTTDDSKLSFDEVITKLDL